MRTGIVMLVILGMAGTAIAQDLGNSRELPEKNTPIVTYEPPAVPKQGGDTIFNATVIPGLPYTDSGITCGYINDYDETCPYTGSTSADVVYSFTPACNMMVPVDLCFSSYDTKVYVYENSQGNLIACNDDFYVGPPCYEYSSMLEFNAIAGTTYYIVIDGYGGACGDYQIDMESCHSPPVNCPDWGIPEGEPPLVDGYIDNWNGGCNSEPNVFQDIHWVDTTTGCGVLCGVSGWYENSGSLRDTDWFPVTAAGFEMSFDVCAEFPCNLFVLNTDCSNIIMLYSASTGDCANCATITWPTNPGDDFWLWVGPTTFSGPVYEFNYLMTVCGNAYDTIPVEKLTWGAVSVIYR